MDKLGKILIGTGIVLTGGYLLKLHRVSSSIQTEVKAQIQKLDLSGITIRVDAKIKNPSSGGLRIKYPFVKLSYKGNVIGSSQVIDKDITIATFGEVNIAAIIINIPLNDLFSVAMDLLKAGTGVKIGIKIMTTVYTAFGSFPYVYEAEQVLKR